MAIDATIYVDGTLATGSNDGTDWTNAYQGNAGFQSALDAVVDGQSTVIYFRNTFTIATGLDCDTGGGTKDNNDWLDIIACDAGGTVITDEGTYVTLDAGDNDLGKAIFTISGVENVRIRHMYCKDNHNGADNTDHGFEISNTASKYNFALINCKATGCYHGLYAHDAADTRSVFTVNFVAYDCIDHPINDYSYIGNIHINPQLQAPASHSCFYHAYGMSVIGGYLEGGDYGSYQVSTYNACYYGVTFYSQAVAAIIQNGTTTTSIEMNNIIVVDTAGSDFAWKGDAGDGSLAWCDYTITNATVYEGGTAEDPTLGPNIQEGKTITFKDAANQDFTLVSVAGNYTADGHPDPNGTVSCPGGFNSFTVGARVR